LFSVLPTWVGTVGPLCSYQLRNRFTHMGGDGWFAVVRDLRNAGFYPHGWGRLEVNVGPEPD